MKDVNILIEDAKIALLNLAANKPGYDISVRLICKALQRLTETVPANLPSYEVLVDFAEETMRFLLEKKLQPRGDLVLTKKCLELYIYTMVNFEITRLQIWNFFFDENLFCDFAKHSDPVVCELSNKLFYSCLSTRNYPFLFNSEEGEETMKSIAECMLNGRTEWGFQIFLFLLKRDDYLSSSYDIFSPAARCLLLELMIDTLASDPVPIKSKDYLQKHFIRLASKLRISEECARNPEEIVILFELLSKMSYSDHYAPSMRTSKELLQASVETLKWIHLLGKESQNQYSAQSPMSSSPSDVSKYPFLGFKKDLVQLIGNLCYKCPQNQDLVRELDGIPLILDCTPLDAKNPFITQHCILALRFLLENNAENQAVVASIPRSGGVENSTVLEQLGVKVVTEGGAVDIKPPT